MKTFIFYVANMHCASCVAKIQKYLDEQPGISVTINLADKQVFITGELTENDALQLIDQTGFSGELVINQEQAILQKKSQEKKEFNNKRKDAYLSLGFGILLMIFGLTGNQTQVNDHNQSLWILIGVVSLLILIYCGRHFYIGGIRSILNKNPNMDTLIALGTGAAWLYSMLVSLFPSIFPLQTRHVYFEASMMIVGLINLGQAIELKARGKINEAIHQLIQLQPKTAIRINENGDEKVDIDQIKVGDQLRLIPGSQVALDGVVLSGQSFVDESMLTGEPIAVEKSVGSTLSAGTINKNGQLIYEVRSNKQNTKLAKIIQLVQEAQTSKIAIGRLADRIAYYFVPAVLCIAIIAATCWLSFGQKDNLSHALISFVSVLIIACPCALGLATPLSIMVSVGRAAKMGILIKNGEALQIASHVNCVVFDKTGTLTQGKPSVTDYICFDPEQDKDLLFKNIASLEKYSEHPLSQAILDHIDPNTILDKPNHFKNHPGQGITGSIQQKSLVIGNESLITQHSIELTDTVKQQADQLVAEAKSIVYVGVAQKIIAILAISDPIRKESFELIHQLKKQHLKPILLSGDHQKTVAYIANQLGISDYYAQMLPDQKQKTIKKLQQEYTVAMIGDGINDAAALATADVGIAIGTGSDIAIESADFTLLSDHIEPISSIFLLAKKTLRNIKQNLFFSFLYNTLGIPLAAGLFYPLTGWLLSPMIAGLAMALSSITVVSNANRLRTEKITVSEQKN